MKVLELGPLKIWRLPCFEDNYIFLLYNLSLDQTVVVDPGSELVVEKFLEQQRKLDHPLGAPKEVPSKIDEIWVTHHHDDHAAGVKPLQQKYSALVRASSLNDQPWAWGDFQVRILDLPGHTLDHVGFWLESGSVSLLFSGDVLFGMGCGRVFEGTYKQMLESLQVIAALPDSTLVFCTHEYTETNLQFSQKIQPDDQLIRERGERIRDLRRRGEPTVPLLLGEEKQTNLFLRSLMADNPLAAFTDLRDKRNKPL